MIHRDELLEDWRLCRENRTPAKIEPLVRRESALYWDVVEVKPEPNYRLFIRFQDGLSGRVQLQLAELTGAMTPLRDIDFFNQVFIDHGAVAWSGEIDLAPDTMYAQVAASHHQPHHTS